MTDDRALANALAFAQAGFGVFSVWNTTDGVCRCPKNVDCGSPGKHPIPGNGLKAATTDPDAIRRMLDAPGSQGQYGVVPGGDVIVIDVDGEGWLDQLAKLGLPKTFSVQTAKGVHLYFEWPPEYGPQPTRLFGWLVRSAQHPGYVIGPGSIHASGYTYRIPRQNGHATELLLAGIMPFPRDKVPKGEGIITVSEGTRLPSMVAPGGRHDFLRDRAAHLARLGLTDEAVRAAVHDLNSQLGEPKSKQEVEQAIGDISQFPVDPLPPPPIDIAAVYQETIDTALSDLVYLPYATFSPNQNQWLIEDLLKPRGVVILSSVEGLGKSWVRTELALRLALGEGNLFGKYRVGERKQVLVINEDNDPDEELERELSILDGLGKTPQDVGTFYARLDHKGFRLEDPASRARLEAYVDTLSPQLLILDTGVQVVDDEHNNAFIKTMGWVKAFALEKNLVVLFIVHQVKPVREGKNIPDMPAITEVQGWWTRLADAVWQLSQDPKNADRYFWQQRKRWGTATYVLKQDDPLWVFVSVLRESKGIILKGVDRDILRVLASRPRSLDGVDGLMDAVETEMKTQDEDAKVPSRSTFHRRLTALEEQGLVEADEARHIWSLTGEGREHSTAPVKLVLVPLPEMPS